MRAVQNWSTSPPICIALHNLRGGGAERACLRLARGMVDENRHVEIVLVRGEGEYLSEIPCGVNVVVLDRPRVGEAILALARHFRKRRPRAILSALTHMNIATLLAARMSGIRTRVILSERNQISEIAVHARDARQRLTYRAVPWVYRAADGIIAVSEGVAADIRSFGHLPDAKVHTIYNPVYSPDIEMKAAKPANHPWFNDNGPPVFLAVGRLSRQKGFDVLLRAFAIARSGRPCRLVILGEGEDRADLQTLSHTLDVAEDVSLPGFAANPYAYMAKAHAFVLSSRWEGFPNALVEAMACGAPVISTRCPSGPSEILEDGRFGQLVPVNDPNTLAEAMYATLLERPDTAPSRARAKAFSLSAAANRYLDVLEARQ